MSSTEFNTKMKKLYDIPDIKEIHYSRNPNPTKNFSHLLSKLSIYSFKAENDFENLHQMIKDDSVHKVNFPPGTDTLILLKNAVILCHSFVLTSQESRLNDLMEGFYDTDRGFFIVDFTNYSRSAVVLMLMFLYTGKVATEDKVDIEELAGFNDLIRCAPVLLWFRKFYPELLVKIRDEKRERGEDVSETEDSDAEESAEEESAEEESVEEESENEETDQENELESGQDSDEESDQNSVQDESGEESDGGR